MDVITIAHYSHNICTFFSAVSQPNCLDIVIELHWKCFLPSTSASDQKCAAPTASLTSHCRAYCSTACTSGVFKYYYFKICLRNPSYMNIEYFRVS